jgi:arylformamidase
MTGVEVTDRIDVPATIRHGMPHWPGNPPVVLQRELDTGRGDDRSVSHLAMEVHSGTHMDGPVHFLHGAAGLDDMPLTATTVQARVIETGHPRQITAGALSKHRLLPGEQVLFRTSNPDRCWPSDSFAEGFAGLSGQPAMYLAETGMQTVGIGYLSAVTGGRHEMICLPVRLHDSDRAPARAVLRPIGSSQPAPAEAAP